MREFAGSLPSTAAHVLCCTTTLVLLAAPSSRAAELLVTDRANNRIVAFDATTGAYERTVLDQGLFQPSSITMGPDGQAYVAHLGIDPNTQNPFGEILKVDPATGAFETFVSGLNFPGNVAYDPSSDTFFLSEFGNFDGEVVLQFDSTGAQINTIGMGTGATGKTGLAFDADGDLYVGAFATDGFFTGAVLKFDADDDFAPLGVFATQTSSGEQQVPFNGASGLVFDEDGNLFAAGLLSHSVVKFPPEGGTDVGEKIGDLIPFATGLLFAEDGNLLVSGLGNDNPADQTFGDNVFPGGILKLDPETGETIGGGPFVGTKIASLNDELGADFDDNELVDAADLAIWESAFGATDAADTDGDGDTDGADFLNYQSNFGALGAFQPTAMAIYTPVEEAAAAAVPEPSTLALAVLLVAFGARQVRRRSTARRMTDSIRDRMSGNASMSSA